MNKKLIALSMATVMLSTTMASESQPNASQEITVTLREAMPNYLSIDSKQDDDTVTLSRLNISEGPCDMTELTLIIPGTIEEKQVHIGEQAFSNIRSNKLRLHLQFKEANGNKVQMPEDSKRMFADSTALASIDLSGASTNNVKNMECMFYDCQNLETLNLSNFNTNNVTNMTGMFSCCENLKELDLSNFNTQNVANMSHMFNNCSSLRTLELVPFNTSNVTNMAGMFCDCSNLTKLNLDNFNTKNVKDISYMFSNCSRLKEVNVNKFDIRNVKNETDMFKYCNEHARKQIESAFVYGDLRDFRSELNQIYWRTCCTYREFAIQNDEFAIQNDEDKQENTLILKEKYKDSRSKVIGEAIGDCVAGKNEFANKKPEDIITFEGTSPENYEQKHWNAVILYNYVHEMINNLDTIDDTSLDTIDDISNVKKILTQNKKFNAIKEYYEERCNLLENALNEILKKSVNVIQAYVGALDLNSILPRFRQTKLAYKGSNSILDLAPGMDTSSSDKSLSYKTYFCWQDKTNHRMLYIPTFTYYDDSLYINDLMRVEQYCSEEDGHKYWIEKEKKFVWDLQDQPQKNELKWLLDQLEGLVIPNTELLEQQKISNEAAPEYQPSESNSAEFPD